MKYTYAIGRGPHVDFAALEAEKKLIRSIKQRAWREKKAANMADLARKTFGSTP